MESNGHIIDINEFKQDNHKENNLQDDNIPLKHMNAIHENTPSSVSTTGTDGTYTESSNGPDDHVNTINNCYEFSISTLDRKLKEIKKAKKNKYKKNRRHSLTMTEDIPIKRGLDNFNQNNGVKIMMSPSKLINEHLGEIQLRTVGHTRAAKMYEKRDKIIGYPVTILSSFLTSAIMMSITNNSDNSDSKGNPIIKYISLTLSVMSFLFSVSRDYLNYSRKFQSHDLSSKLYTTLIRSTEVRLIKTHLDEAERRDIFKDIVDQMSIIEQYETPIPSRIDNKVRMECELLEL
jgi:hypothetical protein